MSKEIAKTLPQLAREINKFDTLCKRTMQTTLQNAMTTGDLLAEAKSQVPHGEWESWVDANTTMTSRTASQYMKIAAGREELGQIGSASDLSIRQAAKLLAAPPEEETTEITLPEEAPVEPVEESDGIASSDSSPPGQDEDAWEDEEDDASAEEEEEEVDKMAEFNRELRSWCTRVTKMVEDLPENAWFDEGTTDFVHTRLKSAASSARALMGVAECPKCGGNGCETCKFTGWVTKQVKDSI